MTRWGSNKGIESENKGLDFKYIFDVQKATAIEMMECINFLEDMKVNNTQFTQKLIQAKNRQVLFDLIDIALRPTNFATKHSMTVTKTMTYTAIEVLTNLSEEFCQGVFCVVNGSHSKINYFELEDEVIQNNIISQNQPQIQIQIQHPFPIFEYFFHILQEAGPLIETALSYFTKIITTFFYQKPQQVFQHFVNHSHQIQTLFTHFYSRSICEVVTKILQIQNQNQFFQVQKLQFLRKLSISISNEKDEEILEEMLQNFGIILENLLQKCEDKYDKVKFMKLIREVLQEKNIFKFITQKIQQFSLNKDVKTQYLTLMNFYLKFNLNQKQPSKHSENDSQNSICQLQLNPEIISDFTTYILAHNVSDFISPKKIQLVYYYKIIRSLISVDENLLEKLITKDFLIKTLQTFVQNPNNDILHNFQKQIIIEAIQKTTTASQILLHPENGFFIFLKENLHEKNSQKCYENQLFHISEALLSKNQTKCESLEEVKQSLNKKRVFYQTLIGGNPKTSYSEHWDEIETELILNPFNFNKMITNKSDPKIDNNTPFSEVARTVSSEYNEFVLNARLEVQSEDDDQDEDQNQNSHFIDYELPLDSDKEEEDIQLEKPTTLITSELVIISSNEVIEATGKIEATGETKGIATGETKGENTESKGLEAIKLEGNKQGFETEDSEDIFKSKYFSSYLCYEIQSLISDVL